MCRCDGIDDTFDVDSTGGVDADGVEDALADSDADGIPDSVDVGIPLLGGALPDLDNNGVADVFEVSGERHTGLAGHGCTVTEGTERKDPTLFLLLLMSLMVVGLRHTRLRKTTSSQRF